MRLWADPHQPAEEGHIVLRLDLRRTVWMGDAGGPRLEWLVRSKLLDVMRPQRARPRTHWAPRRVVRKNGIKVSGLGELLGSVAGPCDIAFHARCQQSHARSVRYRPRLCENPALG